MIASKDSIEPKSTDYVMPNSRRVYVEGELHPDVRVPMREIASRRRRTSAASSRRMSPCASMTAPARGAIRLHRHLR